MDVGALLESKAGAERPQPWPLGIEVGGREESDWDVDSLASTHGGVREMMEQNRFLQAQLRGVRFLMREPLAKLVQPKIRGMIARKASEARFRAIVRLQAGCRVMLAVAQKAKGVRAAIKMQIHARRRAARRRFVGARAAAIMIQRTVRGFVNIVPFPQSRASAVKIQSFARMTAAERAFFKHKTAATSIQAMARCYLVRTSHPIGKVLRKIRTLKAATDRLRTEVMAQRTRATASFTELVIKVQDLKARGSFAELRKHMVPRIPACTIL